MADEETGFFFLQHGRRNGSFIDTCTHDAKMK
jgi:hypothetical protein